MNDAIFDMSEFYARRNSADSPVAEPELGVAGRADGQVCGFLLSVSRDEKGEYWPVRLGDNSMGSSDECCVRLPRGLAEPLHAVLAARRADGELTISVRAHGDVSLNGARVAGEAACHDRDVMALGDGYQMLLLFADAVRHGLATGSVATAPAGDEGGDEGDATTIYAGEEGTVFLPKP